MLKPWMYQGYRYLSQSGMFMTTPMSATNPGGSSSAPAIRKTHDQWMPVFLAVSAFITWAAAAAAARKTNISQWRVSWVRRTMKGTETAVASTTTATQ